MKSKLGVALVSGIMIVSCIAPASADTMLARRSGLSTPSVAVSELVVGGHVVGCSAVGRVGRSPVVVSMFSTNRSSLTLDSGLVRMPGGNRALNVDVRIGTRESTSPARIRGRALAIELTSAQMRRIAGNGIAINDVPINANVTKALIAYAGRCVMTRARS